MARRDDHLRRLEIASFLWNAGEQVYLVGLIVFAYRLGGPAAVAILGILQAGPAVILLPLVLRATRGVRSERLLKALVAVRVIAIGLIAILLAAGVAGPGVFVGAAIDAVAASAVRPTRSALAPRLASSTDELVASNVSISTGRSVAGLVGPAVAAILLATRDVTATLSVGALLLLLALAVVIGVRAAAPLPRIRERVRGESGGGLGVLRRVAPARGVVAVLAGQQFVRGMLPVLFVSLAVGPLHAGEEGVGLLNAAGGAGGLVGGAIALAVIGRTRLAVAFALGVAGWGLALIVPGLAPVLAVALVALAIGGIGRSVLEVTGITLLQRTVPVRERAEVFGIFESLATLSVALGAVVAALLVQEVGPAGATAIAGAVPVLFVLGSWPVVRHADEHLQIPETEIRRLRDVPMLRPLALCTTEELASEVRRVRVEPGLDVVRQGDPGETFFVVESGVLEVIVDGRAVRTIGAGDSFGEIALIRDVPRTATVRALEPSLLTAIERDQFLAAVMGRRDAAAAAEEVIRGHLGA